MKRLSKELFVGLRHFWTDCPEDVFNEIQVKHTVEFLEAVRRKGYSIREITKYWYSQKQFESLEEKGFSGRLKHPSGAYYTEIVDKSNFPDAILVFDDEWELTEESSKE